MSCPTFIQAGVMYYSRMIQKLKKEIDKCSPPIQECGSTGMGRGAAFSQNGGAAFINFLKK